MPELFHYQLRQNSSSSSLKITLCLLSTSAAHKNRSKLAHQTQGVFTCSCGCCHVHTSNSRTCIVCRACIPAAPPVPPCPIMARAWTLREGRGGGDGPGIQCPERPHLCDHKIGLSGHWIPGPSPPPPAKSPVGVGKPKSLKRVPTPSEHNPTCL